MDEINVEQEATKKLPVYQGMGDDEKSAKNCENTTEDKDEDCILNNPLLKATVVEPTVECSLEKPTMDQEFDGQSMEIGGELSLTDREELNPIQQTETQEIIQSTEPTIESIDKTEVQLSGSSGLVLLDSLGKGKILEHEEHPQVPFPQLDTNEQMIHFDEESEDEEIRAESNLLSDVEYHSNCEEAPSSLEKSSDMTIDRTEPPSTQHIGYFHSQMIEQLITESPPACESSPNVDALNPISIELEQQNQNASRGTKRIRSTDEEESDVDRHHSETMTHTSTNTNQQRDDTNDMPPPSSTNLTKKRRVNQPLDYGFGMYLNAAKKLHSFYDPIEASPSYQRVCASSLVSTNSQSFHLC